MNCINSIKNYIGIGELSKFYYYILYSVIFKSLSNFVLSFDSIAPGQNKSLFGFKAQLYPHILIQSFYKYLSFIFFGILFYYFSTKKEVNIKENNNKNNNESINRSRTALGMQTALIFKNNSLVSNISRFDFLIVCIIYVVYLELINITYTLGFHSLDLWPFNIVFTSLFMQIILKKKIFIHQICSLGFIFFVNITISIISGIISDVFDHTEKMLGSKVLSIPIYLIYIGNSFLISYARVLGKSLMELKFISPYKIIFFIGIIGFILTSIILLILEFCVIETTDVYPFEKKISLKNETKIDHFDSFSSYFDDLKKTQEKHKGKFWAEIFATTPANLIFIFLEFQYEILLIYYLNPIYILVSDCIYYGTIALSLFIYKLACGERADSYLDVIADVLAFLGYLIYLEIIEIKICELNKNIKREISIRGEMDILLKDIEELEEIKNDNDEEEEKEDEGDND